MGLHFKVDKMQRGLEISFIGSWVVGSSEQLHNCEILLGCMGAPVEKSPLCSFVAESGERTNSSVSHVAGSERSEAGGTDRL